LHVIITTRDITSGSCTCECVNADCERGNIAFDAIDCNHRSSFNEEQSGVKFCMKVLAAAAVLAMAAQIGNAAVKEVVLRSGAFHGGPHAPADTASGSVRLFRLDNGRYELRLENDFRTTEGPDLFIYLSAAEDPQDDNTVAESPFVDAGKLRSPTGSQKFLLPANFDPSKFKSVAIWCKRFGVLFGVAQLVSK